MDSYDPDVAPDPDDWRVPNERERLMLVEQYHRRMKIELPNRQMHAVFHTIVENQLADDLPDVREALTRLMGAGLSRHDAVHAIGSVVSEHALSLICGGVSPALSESEYFARIRALTANDWFRLGEPE